MKLHHAVYRITMWLSSAIATFIALVYGLFLQRHVWAIPKSQLHLILLLTPFVGAMIYLLVLGGSYLFSSVIVLLWKNRNALKWKKLFGIAALITGSPILVIGLIIFGLIPLIYGSSHWIVNLLFRIKDQQANQVFSMLPYVWSGFVLTIKELLS